jgi:hypothetical protein
MRLVAAKFVPRLLSDDQKSRRLEVCEELKQRVEMEPHFMNRIITGDETWVTGTTWKQSSSLHNGGHLHPAPRKQDKSDQM